MNHFHPSMVAPWPPGARYIRYGGSADGSTNIDLCKYFTKEPKSEYGYFWRDIRRTMGRELGIGHGEIFVLEPKTNEVRAIWRGFLWVGDARRAGLQSSAPCPPARGDTRETGEFPMEVLMPSAYTLEPYQPDATVQGDAQ